MNTTTKPLDHFGNPVEAGDDVTLLEAPLVLLNGLPEEDQVAIRAQVGKRLKINEFDAYGYAELEFQDQEEVIHFIFVEPKYLVK
jgi:nucleoside permease NupC